MTEKAKPWSLDDLDQTLMNRKREMPEGSYVASLFRRGTLRIAQKVGEEAIEVAIAATKYKLTGRGKEDLINEIADLEFHIRVLLVDLDIPYSKIVGSLRRRDTTHVVKGGD